jgi:hypothetical protein
MDARVCGKIDLSPTSGAAQLPNALACRHTDVLCHSNIVVLVFALYLVHPLSDKRGAM